MNHSSFVREGVDFHHLRVAMAFLNASGSVVEWTDVVGGGESPLVKEAGRFAGAFARAVT
jgi:hypothetical protein